MSGKNIRKLQVIDPSVLKSLLEQLNANTKRQTLANIISKSGMNEIIHDYDKYIEAPSDSDLKETLKENLYSRIRQYKNKRKPKNEERIQGGDNADANNGNGGENDDDDDAGPSNAQLLHTKSVKAFKKRLLTKNIKSSSDGFLISSTGKKTNIPFDSVLNDFGRNIKKKGNFMLSNLQKNRVMSILGNAGFAQYNIPNKQIKLAYGTNQPTLRKYIIAKTSPLKPKRKIIKQSDKIPWERMRRNIYKSESDDE